MQIPLRDFPDEIVATLKIMGMPKGAYKIDLTRYEWMSDDWSRHGLATYIDLGPVTEAQKAVVDAALVVMNANKEAQIRNTLRNRRHQLLLAKTLLVDAENSFRKAFPNENPDDFI